MFIEPRPPTAFKLRRSSAVRRGDERLPRRNWTNREKQGFFAQFLRSEICGFDEQKPCALPELETHSPTFSINIRPLCGQAGLLLEL
jgi:hypothetical protein